MDTSDDQLIAQEGSQLTRIEHAPQCFCFFLSSSHEVGGRRVDLKKEAPDNLTGERIQDWI
eukprot:2981990-Amphidinium_carterae.1